MTLDIGDCINQLNEAITSSDNFKLAINGIFEGDDMMIGEYRISNDTQNDDDELMVAIKFGDTTMVVQVDFDDNGEPMIINNYIEAIAHYSAKKRLGIIHGSLKGLALIVSMQPPNMHQSLKALVLWLLTLNR